MQETPIYKAVCFYMKNALKNDCGKDFTGDEKKGVEKIVPKIIDIMTEFTELEDIADYLDLTKDDIAEFDEESDESLEELESREYSCNVIAPQITSLNRR